MSARGAEGILAQRKAATADPAPAVDHGGAGHTSRVKGAVTGAAEGAVAGPEGAVAGGALGAAGGGKKKSSGGGISLGGRTGGNGLLVAELVICLAVLLFKPLLNGGGDVTAGKWLKQASATCALFVILGFISSTGPTGRKAASGLGGLTALAVLLNNRSIFGQIVTAVSGGGNNPAPTPAPSTPTGPPSTLQQYLDTPNTGDQIPGDLPGHTTLLSGFGTS